MPGEWGSTTVSPNPVPSAETRAKTSASSAVTLLLPWCMSSWESQKTTAPNTTSAVPTTAMNNPNWSSLTASWWIDPDLSPRRDWRSPDSVEESALDARDPAARAGEGSGMAPGSNTA
eukprot:CAMPEP_0204254028 /NCGR_PEP_ID=MMETSP0468-20130131/2306_1 /ASSEMBLY_ACC=CAM_ASM_000383 /TAXON_ID=2969 /ORGANISM="Oxyrrhis marina" /LENGTH=117 /DNA_ID=CAMNT_0051227723 /DNA_START=641 /DNA_END=994 /DNA_ORIENTATION=-